MPAHGKGGRATVAASLRPPYHRDMTRTQRDESDEPRAVPRPWDNSGLRHRVEDREIEGVDVLALQSAVVAREAESGRRRRR
jgi:hypothetical protein